MAKYHNNKICRLFGHKLNGSYYVSLPHYYNNSAEREVYSYCSRCLQRVIMHSFRDVVTSTLHRRNKELASTLQKTQQEMLAVANQSSGSKCVRRKLIRLSNLTKEGRKLLVEFYAERGYLRSYLCADSAYVFVDDSTKSITYTNDAMYARAQVDSGAVKEVEVRFTEKLVRDVTFIERHEPCEIMQNGVKYIRADLV